MLGATKDLYGAVCLTMFDIVGNVTRTNCKKCVQFCSNWRVTDKNLSELLKFIACRYPRRLALPCGRVLIVAFWRTD